MDGTTRLMPRNGPSGIHRHGPFPFGLGGVNQAGWRQYRCVVHQDVDAPQVRFRNGNGLVPVLLATNVQPAKRGDRLRPPPIDAFNHRLPFSNKNITGDHLRTLTRKEHRFHGALTARGSRD